MSRTEMHAVGDPTGRMAGQHTRATWRRLRLRTLVALGVLAVASGLFGRAFGVRDARFLGSEVALLAAMFVISRYVLPLLERRDRGASAEEHVGGLLNGLSRWEWRVIHDASLGRGNIDHILVGPAGVFTVETKSHPGPVRVGRLHGATLRQVQAQRRALERIVGLPVEPLLVFSNAWVDRPLARRKGVRVIPARMLLGYLVRRRAELAPEQISEVLERIAAALTEIAERERPRGRLTTGAGAGSSV